MAALCLRGVQDGGGRCEWALSKQHKQEQGPLGAAHLCDKVGSARPRSTASRPARAPGCDPGLCARSAVLWGPSPAGSPRQR